MPSRDAAIPSMGIVGVGGVSTAGEHRRAGGAIRRRVDAIAWDPDLDEGRRDRRGQIQRGLAGRMAAEKARVELRRDLGADGEAAGVQTGPDRGAKTARRRSRLLEPRHGVGRDPLPRSAPAAVEERAPRGVLRHDGHRRAIRGGDRDPRIPGANEEAVGFTRRRTGLDDAAPVDLVKPQRAALVDPERFADPAAVLVHRAVLVPDAQAEVQRRVRSHAHAAAASGEREAGAGREEPRRRAPEWNRFGIQGGHPETMARLAGAAQAICALLLAAGCAHGPAPSSGAEARARFLDTFARADTATRGAGMLAVRHGGKGREGLNTSWAAVRESVAAVAYAGPIRTIDAVVLGDSVYLAIRPYEMGLAGPIPAGAGLGPRGVLFLVRPWAFGVPWVREAIERAAVDPDGEGWRLAGSFDRGDRAHEFTLTLSAKGEPKALRVRLSSDARDEISIRYGPVRRFSSGPVPRWIEWSRGDTRIRLDIEDHAPAKPSQFRHMPPPREDWTILALDDPRGRDLLRRLFGVGGEVTSP